MRLHGTSHGKSLLSNAAMVAGAAMVLYWGGYNAWAENNREQEVAAFQHLVNPDTSLWSPNRIEAFHESQKVDKGLPIGLIRIPSGLEIPIYEDSSDYNLDRGVGWIEGTDGFEVDGGNMGIAGHRDGFFRSLKDAQLGELIEVKTRNGNRTYRITDLAVVETTETSALADTYDTSLTLVTCYPFYFVGNAPQRFIVRADAVADNPESS